MPCSVSFCVSAQTSTCWLISLCQGDTNPLLLLKSWLYQGTNTRHVCLHRAGLWLFMELSSRPGERTAVEPHLAPSDPPERWASASVISLLMCSSTAAEPSHPSMACSFYWGSVSGHVVGFQSCTVLKHRMFTAWSTHVAYFCTHASVLLKQWTKLQISALNLEEGRECGC